MKRLFRITSILAVFLCQAVCSLPVRADDYPSRPITLVCPFGPGGGMDVFARFLAKGLSERLGQPVVVENKAGAGAMLGSSFVARAKPDGYTLLEMPDSGAVRSPVLYKNPPYDPQKDFVPLAMVSGDPFYVLVKADSKIKSFQDFVAAAKADPGKISYGSPGLGSSGHVFMAVLEKQADIKLNHVAYPSSAAVMNDVLAGHIDVTFIDDSTALSNQRGGTVRLLAISTKNRSPLSPDVPSIAELGYPEYDALSWISVVGPAKLPPEIATKLQTELAAVISSPEFQKFLKDQGASPLNYPTLKSMRDFFDAEIAKWGAVLRQLNLVGVAG